MGAVEAFGVGEHAAEDGDRWRAVRDRPPGRNGTLVRCVRKPKNMTLTAWRVLTRHTGQGGIQVSGGNPGRLGDALRGGPDCFFRPGTRVAASPARHIRPRIDRGIHAEPGRDDAGDRVGLDLLDAAAPSSARPGQVTGAGVGQNVAEFVDKRPGGGWRVQPGTYPDSVGAPPGLALAHKAVTPLDRESFAPGQPGEGVPQSRQRVPSHVRGKLRIECETAPRHLTIVERRPPWREGPGPVWTRSPVARLRYTKASQAWTLYWCDRNSRFHLYSGLTPSPRVDDLLQEIELDPTALFWG